MPTVRVYYDLTLFPDFDKQLKRIAKKHHFATKDIGSGAGCGTRDIEFDFPNDELAFRFKEEVSKQGGVKHARLPDREPKPKEFMI